MCTFVREGDGSSRCIEGRQKIENNEIELGIAFTRATSGAVIFLNKIGLCYVNFQRSRLCLNNIINSF